MLDAKSSKLLPVSDFVAMTWRFVTLGTVISCVSFSFEPKINRIATDVKHLAGFTLPHPIKFDRFNYFPAQVIAVSIGHNSQILDSPTLPFYVLTGVAPAIIALLYNLSRCIYFDNSY